MPNYFGAEFAEHPERRNDGIVKVSNPAAFAELMRLDAVPDTRSPDVKRSSAQKVSIADEQRKRREREMRSRLEEQRAADLRSIRARVEHEKEKRKNRLDNLLSVANTRTGTLEWLDEALAEDAARKHAMKEHLYDEWVGGVFRPLQHELNRRMNPIHPEVQKALLGDVSFPAEGKVRVKIDDPTKRMLSDSAKERDFALQTERLLFEHDPLREEPFVCPVPPPKNDKRLPPKDWVPVVFRGTHFSQTHANRRHATIQDGGVGGAGVATAPRWMSAFPLGGKKVWKHIPGSIPRHIREY